MQESNTVYPLSQGAQTISLSGKRGAGVQVIVSAEDYASLSQHTWYLLAGGYAARNCIIDGCKKAIYMHREILGFPSGQDVDHVNGNRLDNRRENLRAASRSQNNYNQRKIREGKSSQYRGVTWCRNKKRWMAQIWVTGKHIVVGYFRDEQEAARARDGAALALHGDFAVRSVPNLEPIPYSPPKPMVKTSSKPGVGWCKGRNKWRAFTTVAGKCKHLGYFRTEEEAYAMYCGFLAR